MHAHKSEICANGQVKRQQNFTCVPPPANVSRAVAKRLRHLRIYNAASNALVSDVEVWKDRAILATLFGGWYASNIAFNLYNKQVLSAFPHPLTMTTLQFGIGSVLAVSMWVSGVVKRPDISFQAVQGLLPLAIVHTLGNVLTNISLGAVSVSFTHTIKAMEPFFSVLLSAIFLGDIPSLPVLLTLFPIVGGVALASMSEASFNWLGFATAMGSNLTFQSRNVLSKKMMLKKEGMDNITMFSIMTVASFFLLLPFSLLMDGWKFTPAYLASAGLLEPNTIIQQACLAGLCFHTYQQVSYMILQRVTPVTHSIGNSVKRVIVIAAAVVFFSTPMSTQNAAGTALALGGVFAYSQVKRWQRKKKEAQMKVMSTESGSNKNNQNVVILDATVYCD
ncbi:hypothetical protein CEUSTIGMA_g6319.t1 [Chlamydomonas eustigma]|uniref:Sugar phosphate transporter domain-containing protein n=1 Tax=Chlamydomonas eustigma TaxID=1157962 RepID=A0A250X7Z0_9CHLO|nr:hypothetical protein CEUSTIGMA_g6319.t1 [Chlamydomonas eustigma]|eukprot:GAX78880.1 hypothetical protein CEUSTIGMA_g6319.t1 [Chlamydomonas eustigma]